MIECRICGERNKVEIESAMDLEFCVNCGHLLDRLDKDKVLYETIE